MPIFNSSVVGIELKDHLAQFVELQARGSKTKMSSYNRIHLPKNLIVNGEIKDEQGLIDALATLFSNANPKIGKVKKAALILPSRLTFVHTFTFPSDFSVKEIRKSLPLQAETIIPFSIDDVYWDFSVSKSSGSGELSVVFAAISKEQADRYARVMQALGVTPFIFGIEMDALSSGLTGNLTGERLKLVIDLNALSSNYLLMNGNEVLSFFSSNEGMNSLLKELTGTEKEASKNYFQHWSDLLKKKENVNKMKKFVNRRFKQGQKIIEQDLGDEAHLLSSVVLTGEFSTLSGSMDLAKMFFKEIAIEAGDPKNGLVVEESRFIKREDDFLENQLYSVFFTHCIGVAKRALVYKDSTTVNLLPSSLRSKVRNQQLSLFISIGLVLIMSASLGMASYMTYLHQILNYNRLSLEVQKVNVERKLFGTRYQEIQEALTIFNDEVAALSSIDAALFSVSSTLEEVMALVPAGVTVTKLGFEDANLILDLHGVADTRETLLELQNSFEDSLLIDESVLPISNYDQKSNISFQMNIRLNFTQLPDYGTSTTE